MLRIVETDVGAGSGGGFDYVDADSAAVVAVVADSAVAAVVVVDDENVDAVEDDEAGLIGSFSIYQQFAAAAAAAVVDDDDDCDDDEDDDCGDCDVDVNFDGIKLKYLNETIVLKFDYDYYEYLDLSYDYH
ncbi:hypothetical protein WICMUC_003209 [Wickerhamomyces mucosus]|uniref:Uncharacterized protein n=1 Tax=Wickerhamomyces mucosus TaxID=1378264 RepID=A0A9P8PN61_9ASCO|nr:hypothetical protein WICMUC_003209 [Wickerhamomyces mucosus]